VTAMATEAGSESGKQTIEKRERVRKGLWTRGRAPDRCGLRKRYRNTGQSEPGAEDDLKHRGDRWEKHVQRIHQEGLDRY
jgi:hypothetical protein